MKRIIKSLTVTVALAAVFAGCQREETGFGPENGGEKPSVVEEGIGYITFADGGVNVEWSGELVSTRAGEEDLNYNDWTVEIWRVSPRKDRIDTMKYAEFTADDSYGLEVSVGKESDEDPNKETAKYKVVMYSGVMTADAEWNNPTYRGETTPETGFEVELANTQKEPLELDIKCTLETIKVSVWLEKDMAETLDKDYDHKFTVEVSDPAGSGGNSLTFDSKNKYGVAQLKATDHTWDKDLSKDQAYAYFKPVVKNNAITLTIDMKYNKKTIKQEIKICPKDNTEDNTSFAHAGEYRRILLYIEEPENSGDPMGNIVINATVETWVWDDNVTVKIDEMSTKFSSEPGGIDDSDDDTDAPVFGGSFQFPNGRATVSVSDADYDFGAYTGDATVVIEAKENISSVSIGVTSNDPKYQDALNAAGLTAGTAIDILNSEFVTRAVSDAADLVSAYGFMKTNVSGKTARFNVKGFFEKLHEKDYSGTHTVTVNVVDAGGHKSSVELVVTNDGSGNTPGDNPGNNGPTITWPGKDMNKRHDVGSDGLKVDIHISAPEGIAHLFVTMSGVIEEGLGSMMPTHFDLVEPEEYQEGLTEVLKSDLLGFPAGKEVEGKTELLFDISDMMGMLAIFPGPSDFELNVVDAKGGEVTRTIKLNVLEQ